MNNSRNYPEIDSYEKSEKETNQKLVDLLSKYKLNREWNFINWQDFFSNLDLFELLEFYSYCGWETFRNKLNAKDKEHSILFFKNFIEKLIINIKKYDSLEKKVNLYIEKWISYWDILFKINILYNYIKKLDPNYKLDKNIEEEIISYKANTSRIWKKKYWPEIIGNIDTFEELIDFYRKHNAHFSEISRNSDKINSISFFLSLKKKFLLYKDDKKSEKFIRTLDTYLSKLWYLESTDTIPHKISNWEESLNKISNKEELKIMYKKLVDWKFFSVKLKENKEEYINYFKILVQKIIYIYHKEWKNPLNTNVAIYTILKYQYLLGEEEISVLNSMITLKERKVNNYQKTEKKYKNWINNIKNAEDLKTYYKALVNWKLFAIKLKNKPDEYKSYLINLVNKVIEIYNKEWISPLSKQSIWNILKYKELLGNEQTEKLEKILESFNIKKIKTSKKIFLKKKKTKKLPKKEKRKTKKVSQPQKDYKKEKIQTKNTETKFEINIQIIINKLKIKQFYKQAFFDLKSKVKDIKLTNQQINEIIQLLKLNDLIEISDHLNLDNEQIKYIINKHVLWSSIPLVSEKNHKNFKKLINKVFKLYKDNEQEEIKKKLERLSINL